MANIFTPTKTTKGNPLVVISVFPANKGLVQSVPNSFVAPEFAIESQNLIHASDGTKRTRPGLTRYDSQALGGVNGVTFHTELWRYDSTDKVKKQSNIVAANNGLWTDTGDGVFTKQLNVTTDDKTITADSLVGISLIGIEGSGLYSYDQTNFTLLSTQPKASIVRKHLGSFWVAGIEDAPDQVVKSDLESTDFAAGIAETFNIDLSDSDRTGVTAISPYFQGRIYVGKTNSIYELDTVNAITTVRPLITSHGMLAHNAVVAVSGDIIYPSLRGLHSLLSTSKYGDVEDKYLSAPISDLWYNNIDFNRHKEISATSIPEYNSYLMLYPAKGATNKFNLLGWNLSTGDFYHWEDYPATFISRHICPIEKCWRMIVGDSDGRISRGNDIKSTSYVDLDNAYSSSFTTPPIFPGGGPLGQFRFKQMTVMYKPRTTKDISISYTIDNKASQSTSVVQSGLTADRMAYKTVRLYGTGQSISLSFSVTSVNGKTDEAAMEILGYNIECEPVGDNLQQVQLQV